MRDLIASAALTRLTVRAEHREEEQGLQLGPQRSQHHALDGCAPVRPAALLRRQAPQPGRQARLSLLVWRRSCPR